MLAPRIPDAFLDLSNAWLLPATPVPYPSIADLAQPMHKLTGIRVVEGNRRLYAANTWSGFDIVRIADGSTRKVDLPPGARVYVPIW